MVVVDCRGGQGKRQKEMGRGKRWYVDHHPARHHPSSIHRLKARKYTQTNFLAMKPALANPKIASNGLEWVNFWDLIMGA